MTLIMILEQLECRRGTFLQLYKLKNRSMKNQVCIKAYRRRNNILKEKKKKKKKKRRRNKIKDQLLIRKKINKFKD